MGPLPQLAHPLGHVVLAEQLVGGWWAGFPLCVHLWFFFSPDLPTAFVFLLDSGK